MKIAHLAKGWLFGPMGLLFVIVSAMMIAVAGQRGAAVGVPAIGGLRSSAMDFGVGALGGLIFQIGTSIFGNSILGGLASAAAAGAVVKGPRGQIVATVAGFQALSQSGLGGGGSTADASDSDVGEL